MKRRRKNGRRNGIRPAALSALAAACVLLAAAHFGCDISAEAALSRLAHSRAFLSCMTALEFGVRADTAEVYVPRTAAAARDENAEAPQSESVYVPAAPQNTAPVLSAADKAATLTINNDTDYEVDVAACLAEDTHIRAAGERDARQLHHLRAKLHVDVRDLRHAPVYQRRAPLLLGSVVGAKPLQRAAGAGEELSVIGHSKALSQILSRRESSPSKSEGRLPRWAALPGALFARWRLSFSSISRGVNSPFSFHERIILFI